MPAESYWVYTVLTGGKKSRNWIQILWINTHMHSNHKLAEMSMKFSFETRTKH